jgi:hypothetical protein
MKLPPAMEEVGVKIGRYALTQAIEMVPDRFRQLVHALIPGIEEAGMEMIGDVTTCPQADFSLYLVYIEAVTLDTILTPLSAMPPLMWFPPDPLTS